MTEETDVFSVRFPKSLIAAIRARYGPRGRNGFLIGAAWAGMAMPEKEIRAAETAAYETERRPVIKTTIPKDEAHELFFRGVDVGPAGDEKTLLDLVKQGPVPARLAEKRLGWQGLRFSKAESALSRAGLIAYENGMLVHR